MHFYFNRSSFNHHAGFCCFFIACGRSARLFNTQSAAFSASGVIGLPVRTSTFVPTLAAAAACISRVMIDDSSVVIGDVRLADDVGIWPLVVIRGDVHYVQIGARTNIQDGSMLHVTHKSSYNPDGNPLTIGEDVTVGHKVMLHGCTIGNRVLVGMGSILLDGAIVEDDVMIGAGSLVPQNKRLESGYLYLGSPVKQIRPLSDEEKAGLRYSANNYVKWKDEYLDQGNQTQP